jgi:ribosomal protein L11
MLIVNKDYRYVKKLFIRSQQADPAPPLGTVLGNLGVQTTNFCTQFNTFTAKLPEYFSLKVSIFIHDNKSTYFKVMLPSTSFILQLLKYESIVKIRTAGKVQDKTINCIKLFSVVKVAKFKFPNENLHNSLPIILGTINSSNLLIVR